MSGLINARVRFAVEGEQIFDYVTSRYLPAQGKVEEEGGWWDLPLLHSLISSGQFIEASFKPANMVTLDEYLVAQNRIKQLEEDTRALEAKLSEANLGLLLKSDFVPAPEQT